MADLPANRIRALSRHTCNLIAAGEMLDRPAAAAKELMENAVDAGATDVTVEIRGGGVDFLRVTDNGEGIAAHEVATAFLPHTTSKLDPQADLAGIRTLGFRGEALAAISAVARVQMLTRARGAGAGWSYTVEYGSPVEEGEAGCPEGTTVMVRGLFLRQKDRAQQLKSSRVEGAAIQDTVAAMALAHPEVAFRFIGEGKCRFATPGDGKLDSAIYATLGSQFVQGLVPAAETAGELSVAGYVTRPSCCEGTRARQLFFVNGRVARGRVLSGALESAYQNQRMVGRYPACVLCLTIPYFYVDVNAHPTKTEVRFLNEEEVYQLVFRAAVNALTLPDRPQVSPAPLSDPRTPAEGTWAEEDLPPASAEPWTPPARPSADTGAHPAGTWAEEDLPPAPAEPWTPPARPSADTWTPPADTWAEEDLPPAPAEPWAPPARPSADTWTPPADTWAEPWTPPTDPWEAARIPPPAPAPAEPAEQLSLTPQDAAGAPWRLVGEVLNTYIIVEQGDTVLLIDKHAAHERLAFDALKAQGFRPMSQELLTPLLVKLGAREEAVLLERAEELEAFGFALEELGGGVVVRRVPDCLAPSEVHSTLAQLAQQYLTAGGADPDSQRDALLRTMACKSAIKGGRRSDPQELLRVARAVMSGQVTHCPHGRPVAVELPRRTLEKEFGRTG